MLHRTLLAAPFLGIAAEAQPTWPARPIRIINPYPAGSPDAMARFLAERLTPALGLPVLVESRSGAGGTIGAEFVTHAPLDGTLLGISNLGPHAMAPVTHIALLGELPLTLAVNAAAWTCFAAAEGVRWGDVARANSLRTEQQ